MLWLSLCNLKAAEPGIARSGAECTCSRCDPETHQISPCCDACVRRVVDQLHWGSLSTLLISLQREMVARGGHCFSGLGLAVHLDVIERKGLC